MRVDNIQHIYLLWDVGFVMYGCQVTQDQFSSFSLSWPAFSAVITKTVNLNLLQHLFFFITHKEDVTHGGQSDKNILQIIVVWSNQPVFQRYPMKLAC